MALRIVQMNQQPEFPGNCDTEGRRTNSDFMAFLALLHCISRATVMAPASVVRPSVNLSFSETAAWIRVKFYGKLHIRHISRPFFSSA